jgi:hypothetical protein
MAELKREVIKMVRDFIKKDYKPRDCCYICRSTDNIELHHLYGVSELFNTWIDKNKIKLNNTVEQIKELRILFAKDNAEALGNDNLYSLCKSHHTQLHSIYGQRYANSLAPKIRNWIEIQRSKYAEEQ